MNKNAFAKVLNCGGFPAFFDRLLLTDLPGEQWTEVNGIRRGQWERVGGIGLALVFPLEAEYIRPHFYPEHAFWCSGREVSEGRLLLRVGVHPSPDKKVLSLIFRQDVNAHTQLMRSRTFINPTSYREAQEVAGIQRVEFLRGWDAYATHLKAMFPRDWERLNVMREEWKKRGAL